MIKNKFKKPEPPLPNGLDSPVTSAGIEEVFKDCYDFETRQLHLGGDPSKRVTLCFIDGLVGGTDVSNLLIRPLTSPIRFDDDTKVSDAIAMMLGGSVYVYTAKCRDTIRDTANDLLNAFCAVIFDDENTAVTFEIKSPLRRQVSEPKEEKVVKGSKDAFVETIKVNSTLVRRKIRDPHLKIKQFKLGEKTQTLAALVYIDGFTNTEIVDEVSRRLSAIKTEGALTSAVIEENIVDSPNTPFPQVLSTERSDKFAVNILEGRVGILVDGLPLGYLAPGTFTQFMKVPEDEANHFLIASGIMLLRYFALVITLLLPAFYVAVSMYHQEMIPTKLMQSMIDAKQAVPFPTALEVVMMLVAFELLQEAGLRLPSPIGQTVSIIGALIVGQSAVEARIVSPVVVVVIALAGIAGYTMPNQDMSAALRLCRFILVITAILLGMFGLALGSAILVYHLSSLESDGVPYMTPFAGSDGKYMGRALFRRSMTKKHEQEPALAPREKGGNT